MEMFANGIRATKHFLRLPGGLKQDDKQEQPINQHELALARIARAYPELIVIANESRDRRP